MLAPIQVESLTLTPIVAKQAPAQADSLLVLDEAMTKKLVRIHEVKDEDLNNLTLTNKSDQPLFLLAFDSDSISGLGLDLRAGYTFTKGSENTFNVSMELNPGFYSENGQSATSIGIALLLGYQHL